MGTSDRAPDAFTVETCVGVNGTAANSEFLLPAIRLGGALGSAARTGGVAGSGVMGCGADVGILAATLPDLRAR